jgi:hypothetical protein
MRNGIDRDRKIGEAGMLIQDSARWIFDARMRLGGLPG